MHLPKQKIIEFKDVEMSYGVGCTPLKNVNLTINEGDFVAITGPNGGGKTTLLRLILQLIKPTAGSIKFRWAGKEVSRLNIGYLPQKNAIDNRFPITVEEVVASGLDSMNRFFHRKNNDDKAAVDAALNLVGLSEVRHHGIGQISGGQLQRALLARATINKRDVLVFDEPLSYIDKEFEKELYQIIGELAKTSTIILVSHEMTTISQMANRHIIIDGTLHECHAAHLFIRSECD